MHTNKIQKSDPLPIFPPENLTTLLQLLHSVKTTVSYSELNPLWLKTLGNSLTLCGLLFLKQLGGLYGKALRACEHRLLPMPPSQ